ncbi:MAG TPA: metallophosphoesterase, partial [Reyranella sp.]|nr:metallophosphoesterase [Reyranella sp.]
MDTPVAIAASLPVEISDWKPAPFDLLGETVFAIGDIHGCADELRALLSTIGKLATQSSGKRRLVYLGDMINRGPDSVGVLELWAADEAVHGVDHIDRLMGNHEIMMMLAVIGGPHAHKAESMWLSKRVGGHLLLDQMRA